MTFVGGKQHTNTQNCMKQSITAKKYISDINNICSEFLLHTNIPPERQSYALAGSTCMLQPKAKIRFKSYTHLNRHCTHIG